mmetsp:Transcript_17912/g.44423  ORF Transcript_17912/g.44423 Transcript_17912/m.44423 type:complete len:202 (-) Transcript_17912:381-986(-)
MNGGLHICPIQIGSEVLSYTRRGEDIRVISVHDRHHSKRLVLASRFAIETHVGEYVIDVDARAVLLQGGTAVVDACSTCVHKVPIARLVRSLVGLGRDEGVVAIEGKGGIEVRRTVGSGVANTEPLQVELEIALVVKYVIDEGGYVVASIGLPEHVKVPPLELRKLLQKGLERHKVPHRSGGVVLIKVLGGARSRKANAKR